MTAEERKFCRAYCDERVRAGMTVLTNLRPSTLRRAIITDNVYLAVTMTSDKGNVEHALIRPPADRVGRFVQLPQKPGRRGIRVAWLDDVIRAALPDIFGQFGFNDFSAHTVKLTRSAELEVDNEFSPRFAERFAGAVKGREKGAFVRLIYDRDIPARTLEKLIKRLRLDKNCLLVPGGRYHNMRDFRDFPRPANHSKLTRPRPGAIPHPVLSRADSLLDACAASDQLMHFPYHDFSLILKLLREASVDPDVSSIQMTAYRLAPKSRVVGALINALHNGKKVFCVVEPRARFDEEANMRWARILEEAGASVSHGLTGHKTHSKAILISRAPKRGKSRDIAVLGTGNFNEDSARIYSDLALATADAEIVRDAESFFSADTGSGEVAQIQAPAGFAPAHAGRADYDDAARGGKRQGGQALRHPPEVEQPVGQQINARAGKGGGCGGSGETGDSGGAGAGPGAPGAWGEHSGGEHYRRAAGARADFVL